MNVGKIEMIAQPADIGGETLMRVMDIFTKIDATRTKVGKQFFQRHDLLFGLVPAVINDDVKHGNLFLQMPPESPVRLVADEDAEPVLFEGLATFINVHAHHRAFFPEIISPHLQAAAASHADFENANLPAPELGKVPVIDVKIMPPLADNFSRPVRVKIIPQRIPDSPPQPEPGL